MSSVIAKNIQIGADTTATNNFTIYQPATPNGTLLIGNGNTGITSSLVTLTSAGNLGIGTSSPGTKLEVNGTIRSGTGSGETLSVGSIDVGKDIGLADGQGIVTGAARVMTFRTSGNVGLGVTSPDRRLHVGSTVYPQLRLVYTGVQTYDIGVTAAGTLGMGVAGTQAMTLDASGRLGVGTTSPANLLHIKSTTSGATTQFEGANVSDSVINITNTGVQNTLIGFNNSGVTNSVGIPTGVSYFANANSYPIAFSTNNIERARISSTGILSVLGVYTNTSGAAANVGVSASGEFYRSTSSLKYKTNVQNASHGLQEVMALRPVTYKGLNNGDIVFGGLIAEEVDAAGLTEFVEYAPDGSPDALAYGQMVSLAFKAIQEQQALILTLQAQLTSVSEDVAALKAAA